MFAIEVSKTALVFNARRTVSFFCCLFVFIYIATSLAALSDSSSKTIFICDSHADYSRRVFKTCHRRYLRCALLVALVSRGTGNHRIESNVSSNFTRRRKLYKWREYTAIRCARMNWIDSRSLHVVARLGNILFGIKWNKIWHKMESRIILETI